LGNQLIDKMITDIKELETRFFQCVSMEEAQELVNRCGAPNVMISIHNPQGEYAAVSATSETLFGRKPKELKGNSAYDFFHPEDFQTILKSHARVTIRPEIDKVEYRLRKADGGFKQVCSMSRQIRDHSGLDFLLVLTFERR
jgi:PAS domain S-box-containing protein